MSQITMSPKYRPLFQLLKSWEMVKSDKFKSLSPDKQKYWTKLSKVHTVILTGGRDSGKSHALSLFNCIASHDYGHRILYTRQTMSSTDNSIREALEKRMEALGYREHFDYANQDYTVKGGGSGKITITGQRTSSGTQTAKLKSIEGYSIFETDEGEELESHEGWKKIKRSIRATDVQALSIIAFNPPTSEHWLYSAFFEEPQVPEMWNGIKNNTLYIHSTYLDNVKNMSEHNLQEYEELKLAYIAYHSLSPEERDNDLKLKKQAKEYEHVVLGAFRNTAEGIIFEDVTTGDFNESLSLRCYGCDYGFSDPDAVTDVAVDIDQKIIYCRQVIFMNGLGTDELAKMILDRVGYTSLVVADSSHPRLTKLIREKGVNIESARKGRNSVSRGIKLMKSYTIIVDRHSPDLIKAFANYRWKDKRSEIPHHDYSDLVDSVRYAFTELIA